MPYIRTNSDGTSNWIAGQPSDLTGWEYTEEEPTQPLLEAPPNWSEFSVKAVDSMLFALAESSENPNSFKVLNLIIGLTNNSGLQSDPATLSEGGRLQQRLQKLIATLTDTDLADAIAEFNQILTETLKINWQLQSPE